MSHPVALNSVSADISAHDGSEQAYAFPVGKNRSCRRLAVRFHSKRHDVASGRVENVGVRKHVVANFTGVQKPAGIGSEFPDPCDVMTHWHKSRRLYGAFIRTVVRLKSPVR